MNGHDFEQAQKHEERWKYCGKILSECICSPRRVILDNRECAGVITYKRNAPFMKRFK